MRSLSVSFRLPEDETVQNALASMKNANTPKPQAPSGPTRSVSTISLPESARATPTVSTSLPVSSRAASEASQRSSRGSLSRSTSFLQNVDHTSERVRLVELLRAMSPQDLQLTLLSHLTLSDEVESDRRRAVQAALSVIFPPSGREFCRDPAHCARCHGSFDPKFNRGAECKIAHSETAKHEVIKRTTAQSVWRLSCCGAKITQPGDAEKPVFTEESGYCYAGPHALTSDDVEWFNMVTIFRCNGSAGAGPAPAVSPSTTLTPSSLSSSQTQATTTTNTNPSLSLSFTRPFPCTHPWPG